MYTNVCGHGLKDARLRIQSRLISAIFRRVLDGSLGLKVDPIGPILWDFKLLIVEFCFNQRKIMPRGSPPPRLQMMQGRDLAKAM